MAEEADGNLSVCSGLQLSTGTAWFRFTEVGLLLGCPSNLRTINGKLTILAAFLVL